MHLGLNMIDQLTPSIILETLDHLLDIFNAVLSSPQAPCLKYGKKPFFFERKQDYFTSIGCLRIILETLDHLLDIFNTVLS